jgi:hypothetical protein
MLSSDETSRKTADLSYAQAVNCALARAHLKKFAGTVLYGEDVG